MDNTKIAEKLVREHKDFVAEGFSDYMNGLFNGIILGLQYEQKKKVTVEVCQSFIYSSPEYGKDFIIPLGTKIESDTDFFTEDKIHCIDIFMKNIFKYRFFLKPLNNNAENG